MNTFVNLALSAVLASSVANGALYNLTSTTFSDTSNTYAPDTLGTSSAVYVEGALFERGATNSGAGVFRNLFRISKADNPEGERGYNRASGGGLDESFIGQEEEEAKITKSSLVLDASGNNYVFLLDVNENGFATIDALKIWVDPNSATNGDNPGGFGLPGGPYPGDPVALGAALGISNLVYDLDASQDNAIIYDGTITSGSGSSDLVIFVPKSSFASYAPDDYVYLYFQMNAYDHPEALTYNGGVDTVNIVSSNGNAEAVALPGVDQVFVAIPEPGSMTLLLLALGMGIARRSR